MCIAVSQTADPTAGTWFLYTFDTIDFPDYPKFGVWPDGYYMSSYESPNLGVYVFDRANMVAGNPATFMKSTIAALGAPGVRDTRVLPADLDGAAPAVGTPNFFVRSVDDQQDPVNPNDRIEVYNAVADFATSTFTFTLADTLTPAPFQTMLCNRNGGGVRDCIPQPDTTATVDALSNRPMMQLKYRSFGTHQAMVFNQTIDVAGSMPIPVVNEVAGIRWYELRNTGAGWTIFQEGTYAPQPTGATNENQMLHRWMGSMAMDMVGNIGLGYSITNDDDNNEVFPGIRYAGRHSADPLGTLPQGEMTIFDGTNSQTGGFGQRWGDYSALSIDPRDDCAFWFTTHVAGAGGAGARPTRIASFRFDDCSLADLLIVKTDSPDPVAAGGELTYTLTVTNNGPSTASDVELTDTLPAEVSYVSDDGGCILAAPSVSCNLGHMVAAATRTIQIVVKVDDLLVDNTGSATITNEANVSSPNTPDPDIANNTAVEDTVVLPGCGGMLATIVGTLGDDNVLDTAADDVISTLAGDDTVVARRGGDDAICTGGGDDTVVSRAGNNEIYTGPGDDNIGAGPGDDVIDAGSEDDSIVAGAGDDMINAGAGDDHINAGSGSDAIDGGIGNDNIGAGPGDDAVDAGPGNDSIAAGSGDDGIAAGPEDDTVGAGPGDDTVDAGPGDDKINAGPGNDLIDGGPGTDTCVQGEVVIQCE
jgi:uncharacterized repeat protein (TIGR01451 family)